MSQLKLRPAKKERQKRAGVRRTGNDGGAARGGARGTKNQRQRLAGVKPAATKTTAQAKATTCNAYASAPRGVDCVAAARRFFERVAFRNARSISGQATNAAVRSVDAHVCAARVRASGRACRSSTQATPKQNQNQSAQTWASTLRKAAIVQTQASTLRKAATAKILSSSPSETKAARSTKNVVRPLHKPPHAADGLCRLATPR